MINNQVSQLFMFLVNQNKINCMKTKSTTNSKTLHKRNPHNSRYDFDTLIKSYPDLKQYVSLNKYDDMSIDFSSQEAVLALNKSLLSYFYNIKNWGIPENYLTPPIPGRADYIHYISDLIPDINNKVNKNIKVLDIGIGANCIYPIVGSYSYGWQFIGSDIDKESLENANKIIEQNTLLSSNVTTILQTNKNHIFKNIIKNEDRFYFTICNPPFHKSAQDAVQGSKRKVKNLTKSKYKLKNPPLNFGGQKNELWCDGGEIGFISKIIQESVEFKENCFWFTTLVSKEKNLEEIYKLLKKEKIQEIRTINMKQGNKISRIIAWSFLTKETQKEWNKLLI